MSQKGLAPILIILILTALVGGYLINSKQKPTAQPSPSSTNETANWKTYTNEKFNYSIKYPPGYTPYGETSKPFDLSIIPAKDAKIVIIAVTNAAATYVGDLDPFLISIDASNINPLKNTRKELQESIDKEIIEQKINEQRQPLLKDYTIKRSEINVNGIVGDTKSTFYKGELLTKFIYIDSKSQRYFLQYNDSLKIKYPSEYPSLNETVLSTFKFLP